MRGFVFGGTSPCLYCVRVKNPRECENKNCKVWQKWFLARWELLRHNICQPAPPAPESPAGVSIGGHTYYHPDHIRQALQAEPCKTCKYPPELCTAPCRVHRSWDETRGDVLL